MFLPIVRSVWKKRAYHAVMGAPLIRGAARIVATAERERDELVVGGVDPAKIVVRRNGIESRRSRSSPRAVRSGRRSASATTTFSSSSSAVCRRRKGSSSCCARWRICRSVWSSRSSDPDDGDGALQGLERDVARLGLDARVRLLGPRYDRAKVEALVDADLFVLPSQNENFGNAVIEAIACGVPALVTRECGVAPIVDGKAGLAVPYDERAIAQGLQIIGRRRRGPGRDARRRPRDRARALVAQTRG